MKKVTFNNTYKCFKTSKFHWKNDLDKITKKLYVNFLPVSKYASSISFTVEKVYTMSVYHFRLGNPRYNRALNFLSINF